MCSLYDTQIIELDKCVHSHLGVFSARCIILQYDGLACLIVRFGVKLLAHREGGSTGTVVALVGYDNLWSVTSSVDLSGQFDRTHRHLSHGTRAVVGQDASGRSSGLRCFLPS